MFSDTKDYIFEKELILIMSDIIRVTSIDRLTDKQCLTLFESKLNTFTMPSIRGANLSAEEKVGVVRRYANAVKEVSVNYEFLLFNEKPVAQIRYSKLANGVIHISWIHSVPSRDLIMQLKKRGIKNSPSSELLKRVIRKTKPVKIQYSSLTPEMKLFVGRNLARMRAAKTRGGMRALLEKVAKRSLRKP